MFFVGPHIRSPGDCHRIDRGGMDFLPGPLSGPLLPSSSHVAWGADREHLSNVSASSRVRPPPPPLDGYGGKSALDAQGVPPM